MVLIRQRYFVQHLIARHKKKQAISNIATRLTAIISGTFFQYQVPNIHVVQESRHNSDHNNSTRIHAEDGIGAALAEAGGTGLGLGIVFGVRTPHLPEEHTNGVLERLSRASLTNSDHTRAEDNDVSHTDHHSFQHIPMNRDIERILSEAHSFTSSPRSGAAPLPQSPTSPRRPNRFLTPNPSNSYYYDRAGNIRKRRPGENSYTPLSFKFIALTTCPLVPDNVGIPMPRRQTIISPKVPYSSNQIGQREKDQGLGGFPGPIRLLRRLVRYYAPKTYGRMGRTLTIMPTQTLDRGVGDRRWLPAGLSELVIGRNSDFNTDELTDEQLEELGGIEYVANVLMFDKKSF